MKQHQSITNTGKENVMTSQIGTCTSPRLGRARPGLLRRLFAMDAVWRQRLALSELDPDLLNDIGVTAAEARREAAKPVWDVPSRWLR
jgi:uncharacterized protein YjiS (DUF1127 family)